MACVKSKRKRQMALPLTGKSFGGDEEDRTPGLGIANAALSQLSYIPEDYFPVQSFEFKNPEIEILNLVFWFFNSEYRTMNYSTPAGSSEPFGSDAKA